MKKSTHLIIAVLLLAILINTKAPSLYLGRAEYKSLPHYSLNSALINPRQNNIKLDHFSFDNIDLKAKSALIMKINTGEIIFEKNIHSRLPLASLTKLMTALVAEEMRDLEILIPITKDAVLQEGDSGLIINEKFKASVLRDLMLLGSSNDAAYALADGLGGSVEQFVKQMNKEAEKLGLSDSVFANPTGLDINNETEPGAIGTAFDLSKLSLFILKNYSYIFDITTKKEAVFLSESGLSHKIENTNELVLEIPGLIGGKTGFSDLGGGNLLIIADISFNEPYLFIVLGSTYEGRFEDMKKLYQAVVQQR